MESRSSVDDDRCVVVRSSTPRTVDLVQSLSAVEAAAFLDVAASMLDALAAGVDRCRAAGSDGPTASASIIDVLRGMESSRREDAERMLRAVQASGAQAQQAAVSLICAVESTVRGALEQLSVDSLSRRLAETLRDSTGMAEQQLRNELQLRLIEPLAARHEQLALAVAALPAHVATSASHEREGVIRQLSELRSRVDELASRQAGEVAKVSELLAGEIGRLRTHVDVQATQHVPVYVVRALSSVLGDIQERGALAQARMESVQEQLARLEAQAQEGARRLQAVEKGGDGVSGKIDTVTRQLAAMQVRHSRSKGLGGETRLLEMLSAELPVRRGYSVEVVSGMAHSCDLVVRRSGMPDVRIESKVYSDKVGAKEVHKFRSDLMGLDAHGVFVSLESGIVGMSEIEVEQLPSGRFAVYLSNNNYNISLVRDMIELVYKLDRYCDDGGGGGGEGVRVPTEVMKQVQHQLHDMMQKVGKMKMHLKETVQLLNQVALDQLERLLLGQQAAAAVKEPARAADVPARIKCPRCSKTYGAVGRLAKHLSAVHGEDISQVKDD